MLSKNMVMALNSQVKHELYSSYLYLSMSAYSDSQNLKGFAHWLRLQADEEREHGLKIFDYLLANGAKAVLEPIEQPPVEFGSPKALFQKVLEHEQKVTALIHKLYEQAMAEKDYRTQIMLQWFVTEQMVEEENAQEILSKIEAVEEKMNAIMWIDKELKKRGE
ncbi:ferritin [candidate division KSB1 bacterium]|nr:MAG: ferritin [candidate division KSB1 bacterium]